MPEDRTFIGAEVPNDMYAWMLKHKSARTIQTGKNVSMSDMVREALDLYRERAEQRSIKRPPQDEPTDADAFVRAFVEEAVTA